MIFLKHFIPLLNITTLMNYYWIIENGSFHPVFNFPRYHFIPLITLGFHLFPELLFLLVVKMKPNQASIHDLVVPKSLCQYGSPLMDTGWWRHTRLHADPHVNQSIEERKQWMSQGDCLIKSGQSGCAETSGHNRVETCHGCCLSSGILHSSSWPCPLKRTPHLWDCYCFAHSCRLLF